MSEVTVKPDSITVKPDRAMVRALAERNTEELQRVADSGGNAHQKLLDQQDKVKELAASMSEKEAAEFLKMYEEELTAYKRKAIEDAVKSIANIAATGFLAQAVIGIIGFIAMIVFVFLLFN